MSCTKAEAIFLILDIALFKHTAQSSTTMSSYKAVDGNNATDYLSHLCTHTHYDNPPWWEVDFGKIYNITGVEITNRGDCCGERLRNFDVTVDTEL